MADPRRDPLQSLLDLVVYAPIGAFFHGPEVVGEMAERGRATVKNARVVGTVAVARGRREIERVGTVAQQRLSDAMVAAARAAGAPLAGADGPGTANTNPADHTPDDEVPAAPPPSLRVVPDSTIDAGDLPIPDYDNLSASQVVPRLDDLAQSELVAVRDYEQAHRGRMTILSRIAQLQAS